MTTVAYSSPFVPPEWIAAHGLQPLWLPLGSAARAGISRGLCPYAEGLLEAAASPPAAALVVATTCDQIRHAVAAAEAHGPLPLFLVNVPATWESPAAVRYYRDELLRLGRFLLELGGTSPPRGRLARIMLRYDRARAALRGDGPAASRRPARQWAEAIHAYRSGALRRYSERRGQCPPLPAGEGQGVRAYAGYPRSLYLPNTAALPNSASISSSRLYLAIRSLRQAEPVLIWPPPIATAKSARKASSVSPERCDTT